MHKLEPVLQNKTPNVHWDFEIDGTANSVQNFSQSVN